MKKFVVKVSTGVQAVDSAKEAVAVLKKDGIEVTQRALLAGGVDQCQIVDEAELPAILAAEGQVLTDTQDAGASTDTQQLEDEVDTDDEQRDKDMTTAKEPVEPKKATKPAPATTDDIEYPEVGHFKDEKAMKKFIKPLTNDQLQEWCELEGVTWKPCDHEAINRMRMAMAIKAKHFPHTAPKASTKSKSKYSHYATEELVQMALDNDIEVDEKSGDLRILRMKTIMALRNAGIIN